MSSKNSPEKCPPPPPDILNLARVCKPTPLAAGGRKKCQHSRYRGTTEGIANAFGFGGFPRDLAARACLSRRRAWPFWRSWGHRVLPSRFLKITQAERAGCGLPTEAIFGRREGSTRRQGRRRGGRGAWEARVLGGRGKVANADSGENSHGVH